MYFISTAIFGAVAAPRIGRSLSDGITADGHTNRGKYNARLKCIPCLECSLYGLYAVIGYPYNMQFQKVSLHPQCNGSHNGQERPDIFPNHDNKVNSEYCLDWISKTNAMGMLFTGKYSRVQSFYQHIQSLKYTTKPIVKGNSESKRKEPIMHSSQQPLHQKSRLHPLGPLGQPDLTR